MPRGDGTGPFGAGPMTGRAAGYCAGYGVPGYMNHIPGRGLGRGFWGTGRGWRHCFYATGLPGWARFGWALPWGSDKEMLKAQTDALQARLDQIRSRLEDLDKDQTK
ncbi:MAG: DUF5320 domain-containing protein [Sedimentisphaerales bacterium]|jgi:hypothetical protein|nr:DUF5320 domain-containing protein [Sedimentisphaerales bacterium]